MGIDSTGLKVYGEGEWKARKQGYLKRRTWQKLQLCMDLDTQEILRAELTGNEEDDASVGTKMLKGKTIHIDRFIADEAYDKFGFREILGSDILQIIPPLKNAVIQKSSFESQSFIALGSFLTLKYCYLLRDCLFLMPVYHV